MKNQRSHGAVAATMELLDARIALTAAPTPGVLNDSLVPLGVVYVMSNNPNPGQNEILAYKRQADGSHTLMGKFNTGGTGFLNANDRAGPDNNDRPIIVHNDRKWLFAVNGGDDTVTSFRINADGSLTRVQTRVSGGTHPVSLEIVRDKLYVLNKGDTGPFEDGTTPPQLRILRIKSNGQLARFDTGAINFNGQRGSSASTVVAAPDNRSLQVLSTFFHPQTDAQVAQVVGFEVLSDGNLRRRGAAPSPIVPRGADRTLEGLTHHPASSVGTMYAGLGQGSSIAVVGKLSWGTPYNVGGVAASVHGPSQLTVDADGEFMYAVSAAGNAVSVFSLAELRVPELVQVHLLAGPRHAVGFDRRKGEFNTVARQVAIDPTGQRLYVVNQEHSTEVEFPEGNQLHVLNIGSDGLLSEPTGPIIFDTDDVPANAHPQGVVPI